MKKEILHTEVPSNTVEQNRFISINDFKFAMKCHSEVNFEWNNKEYWITPDGEEYDKYVIYEPNKPETEKVFSTIDELLDHKIDGELLRNIVMKLKVWGRTI